MFRGGRNSRYKSGNGRGGGNRHTITQPRGLFADGIWQCDCEPRLPAEHFKVKKDGKNHGRWFYTCQKAQEERCGFFLWDEDAKPREESAVLNNTRTETGQTKAPPLNKEANPAWQQERGERQYPSPPKRKASPIALSDASTDGGIDDDELMSWPATAQQEPSTPRKAIKTDAYATPATSRTRRLPWLDYSGEDSPETTPSKASVPAPTTPAYTQYPTLPTPDNTKTRDSSPTRSRFRDALATPPPGEPALNSLTTDILTLLSTHAVSLPTKAEADLRAALNRHELKLQGALKGRELVRTALRARDNRIVQLQARIAGVEAESEVLRRGLMDMDDGIGNMEA